MERKGNDWAIRKTLDGGFYWLNLKNKKQSMQFPQLEDLKEFLETKKKELYTPRIIAFKDDTALEMMVNDKEALFSNRAPIIKSLMEKKGETEKKISTSNIPEKEDSFSSSSSVSENKETNEIYEGMKEYLKDEIRELVSDEDLINLVFYCPYNIASSLKLEILHFRFQETGIHFTTREADIYNRAKFFKDIKSRKSFVESDENSGKKEEELRSSISPNLPTFEEYLLEQKKGKKARDSSTENKLLLPINEINESNEDAIVESYPDEKMIEKRVAERLIYKRELERKRSSLLNNTILDKTPTHRISNAQSIIFSGALASSSELEIESRETIKVSDGHSLGDIENEMENKVELSQERENEEKSLTSLMSKLDKKKLIVDTSTKPKKSTFQTKKSTLRKPSAANSQSKNTPLQSPSQSPKISPSKKGSLSSKRKSVINIGPSSFSHSERASHIRNFRKANTTTANERTSVKNDDNAISKIGQNNGITSTQKRVSSILPTNQSQSQEDKVIRKKFIRESSIAQMMAPIKEEATKKEYESLFPKLNPIVTTEKSSGNLLEDFAKINSYREKEGSSNNENEEIEEHSKKEGSLETFKRKSVASFDKEKTVLSFGDPNLFLRKEARKKMKTRREAAISTFFSQANSHNSSSGYRKSHISTFRERVERETNIKASKKFLSMPNHQIYRMRIVEIVAPLIFDSLKKKYGGFSGLQNSLNLQKGILCNEKDFLAYIAKTISTQAIGKEKPQEKNLKLNLIGNSKLPLNRESKNFSQTHREFRGKRGKSTIPQYHKSPENSKEKLLYFYLSKIIGKPENVENYFPPSFIPNPRITLQMIHNTSLILGINLAKDPHLAFIVLLYLENVHFNSIVQLKFSKTNEKYLGENFFSKVIHSERIKSTTASSDNRDLYMASMSWIPLWKNRKLLQNYNFAMDEWVSKIPQEWNKIIVFFRNRKKN